MHETEVFEGMFDTFELTCAVDAVIIILVKGFNDISVRVPARLGGGAQSAHNPLRGIGGPWGDEYNYATLSSRRSGWTRDMMKAVTRTT